MVTLSKQRKGKRKGLNEVSKIGDKEDQQGNTE